MNRDPSSVPNAPASAAEDLWLRCVARELAGEHVDFDALCAQRPELAHRLRELRAAWLADERVAAPAPSDSAASRAADTVGALMRRLAATSTRAERYRDEGEIARGGMGVVHRVWDGDLNRALALKVLRNGASAAAVSGDATLRFVEEAQVTAQLDHPGIVPVHEIGVDESGRPFFAMKLVEGSDLRRVFELAWTSAEGWNTTRVLGVLLKVCEALGYAHEKGVIHRDLKPSNVMVGRFGEVYVMDWGVARVLGRGELHEPEHGGAVATVRSVLADDETDSRLLTSDGEVIGTAAYMSPEQARGELGRLSPRSDVYALGAMLYQLLAREMPYASDAKTTAQVLERVRRGPPRPLTSFDERAAPELVAICSKAMAREPEQRYANLSEVADDLRAYLEGRVVRAHATGAWTTARKWARRNRALTLSLVAILIAAAVGVWQARRSAVVRANFDMLARLRQRTELLDDYEALWPATPATLPALERWLTSAEGAASQLDGYRAQLAELRSRALPWNELSPSEQRVRRQLDADTERARRLIAHLEEQRDELRRTGAERSFDGATLAEVERQIEYDRPVIAQREAKLVARQTWSFEAPIDQLMHDRLVALIPDTERLTDRERGFSRIERVRHAIAVVREIERRDPAATSAAWERARAAIRDLAQCPMYAGLDLKPQPGLLPLGPDPSSGLWEFAHLATGAPPTRDAHGRLAITPESGLVLVLLPGGPYVHGAQPDAGAPNFDPQATLFEGPPESVLLDPFFISKFEMTRAQWARWTDEDMSRLDYDRDLGDRALRPVYSLDWQTADTVARELDLALPTEAQWEYAARAGATARWSTTDEVSELHLYANLFDPCVDALVKDGRPLSTPGMEPDGHYDFAPVGSFLPNEFGLYDTLGNVAEWCADKGSLNMGTPRWLGTGGRATNGDDGARVVRGGHCGSSPADARVAARYVLGPQSYEGANGLRPVRALEH